MNTSIITVFVAVMALTSLSPARAMPLAPLDQAETTITLIAGGCGTGWHRGPGGQCRRNTGCGRGYRLTPNGCRRQNFGAVPAQLRVDFRGLSRGPG
jgi:hypothetical protein